ncbi:MAG: PhoH family protein, partial [Dermabacter sp.]|nr:PhoH family protein [Dermabacter sp.]
FCHLSSKDVVRHRLVSAIVDAYARWDLSEFSPKKKGKR